MNLIKRLFGAKEYEGEAFEIVCDVHEVRVQIEYNKERNLSKISCPIILGRELDDGGCFSKVQGVEGGCGCVYDYNRGSNRCKIIESQKGAVDSNLVIKTTCYTEMVAH